MKFLPVLFWLVLMSAIQSDSLRVLKRTKRRWVLTTFVLKENAQPPFPKIAGDLFNDQAVNMSIRYLISGPGVDTLPEIGLFSMDDQTGRVYVHRTIDREKTPLFEICFDAAERATGRIVDRSLIFNIEVEDENDNPPVFRKPVYEIKIKETVNLDNPVIQVIADDKDKEGTLNSVFTYSLLTQIPSLPSVKFSIDPKVGLIRGQGCLNYETASVIKLIVGARDNGNPQLSSTATVILNILDGNNNLPALTTQNFNLTVKEGETSKELLRIKVEDKDLPHTPAWCAKFKIISGNENQNFNLTTDPVTNEGVLDVIKPLDFESTLFKIIKFSVDNEEPVFVCNNSKLRLNASPVLSSGTIYITVTDLNDAPIFNPPSQTIRQKEGLPPGTVLGRVNATDPDRVPNKIRFTIAEDPAGWVTVDEVTGEVKTVQELDRESPEVKDNLYKIVIHAIDDGSPPQTGSSTLNLLLSDINDNKPRLVTPYVERCERLSKQPLSVQAVDKDQDPFSGPFTFELGDTSRAIQEMWQLGRSAGDSVELSMLQNLPRGNYSVPLTIFDRQGSASTQALVVRVCFCPDGVTCEKMQPSSHSMGGGGIGIIIGALLLLLLAVCLLMCFLCSSGKKKRSVFLPNDEGNQTLIKYNEEGGSALSQASPALLFANGNGRGNGNIDFMAKDKDGVGHSGTLQRNQLDPWEQNASGTAPSNIKRQMLPLMQDKDGVGHSGTLQRNQLDPWEQNASGTAPSNIKRQMLPLMQDKDGVGHSGTLQRNQLDPWEQNASGTAPSNIKRQMLPLTQAALNEMLQQNPGIRSQTENSSYTLNSKYMKNGSMRNSGTRAYLDRVGEILNYKLQGFVDESDTAVYQPRTYAYEGELDRVGSMSSFSIPGSENDLTYLDDLGSKFSTLEEICRMK
uniref:Cadherin-like protein 26 n=1 Tax=Leptobrachium leishanense TaxID=445787 RepID=A0A8C5PYN6_9ANUR